MKFARLAVFSCALLACDSTGDDDDDGPGTTTDQSDDIPTCSESCVDSIALGCANGPPDQATCESDCESFRAGPCTTQNMALLECGGRMPQLMCDGDGRVAVVGCEAEMAALVACLSS